jgi:hypothetical protein
MTKSFLITRRAGIELNECAHQMSKSRLGFLITRVRVACVTHTQMRVEYYASLALLLSKSALPLYRVLSLTKHRCAGRGERGQFQRICVGLAIRLPPRAARTSTAASAKQFPLSVLGKMQPP